MKRIYSLWVKIFVAGAFVILLSFMMEDYGFLNLNALFCNKHRFDFINKELACSPSLFIEKHAYIEFKTSLEEFVDSKWRSEEVEEVSVYFRDLKNGPTLGLNEHASFAPASLLKVPLLVSYLSLAEGDPELLERKLTYHTLKDVVLTQYITPKESIKENTSYTIRELLTYLIKYSDNKSYIILLKYLEQIRPGEDFFGQTVVDLGIIDPDGILDEVITVKSYASIFTQLYHASFFKDKETSETALSYLIDTDFNKGLVAGIPSGVKIAHKFGERAGFPQDIKQLHDCGIVYYPENPYLLCVMTRGQDMDKLANIISTISRMFYEEFDSRKI